MKLSNSYFYTLRENVKDEDSTSGNLLVRAGMIKKSSSGIYMIMPMGKRVLKKIEEIVREEMDAAGAQELLMPAMIPEEIYEKSGRREAFGSNMFALKDRYQKNYVLGREVTLEEIKASAAQTKVPLEVFIHGGMCISYSGRCVLSNNMTGRDANRGGCAQSCRWKYRLYEGNRPLHDEQDLFSMSSKDLMAAKYIPDLIEAGIASLKIEGRMKLSLIHI